LEIARKNATRLAMEGRLPKGIELGATLKNKTVRELIRKFPIYFLLLINLFSGLCEDIQSRDLELAAPENLVTNDDGDDTGDFSTAPVKASGIDIRIKVRMSCCATELRDLFTGWLETQPEIKFRTSY
jgi:hypothetical protein